MPTVLPAMRGKFGSTDYFIVTMPAKELTERLVIPTEMDGWSDLSIEERYQRDVNYNRVKNQIAPYLAHDPNRFIGAFIVTMLHAEDTEFEPMAKIFGEKVPNLYKSAGSAFGFLTLEGKELLVPLDGQHRLAALGFAITGKDEKQKDIPRMEACPAVAEDTCTVMLIKHEDGTKARSIFNKVNRYAKATTKAENLITADDDVIAVIVRESIIGVDKIIPDGLVNIRSNTLAVKAREFTTLSTLYEATKYLLEDTHGRIDTAQLPDRAKQNTMQREAVEFWETLCTSVDHIADGLLDPTEHGDERRREIRRDYLLGKPVAQWALVQAIVQLREPDATAHRKNLKDVCKYANQLDWSMAEPRWQGVLMNGDRVVSGKTAVNFASQAIAYWLGRDLSEEAIADLRERYASGGGPGQIADPIR